MPLERVVWGPPGTGKTSSAITLVRNWMDEGTDPTRISFLAFTKASAKAAAVKVFETEDDTKMMEKFPYFRTVHSLCWRGLHKNRDVRLISTGDMKQFAKNFSMDGAYSVYDWEDLSEVYAQMKDQGKTEWDTALAAYQMTRVKAQSIADLDKARLMPNTEGLMMLGIQNMGLNIYQEFVEKYERFKLADGLVDFTDMLEYGVREMPPFDDIRYVLLDECQDLAGIHHLLVDRVLSKAEEIWWIGDDDQAIFKFSGASAELFLERAKRAKVQLQLRQTRRFGQNIVNFSNQIISRVAHRHPKEIIGVSGREGVVRVTGEFEPIPGNVMILHRHVMGCLNVAQSYMDAGLPFRNERGLDPLGYTKRIKIWETIQELAKGKAAGAASIAVLVEDGMGSHVVEENKKIELLARGAKTKMEEMKGALTLKDLIQARVLTPEGAQTIEERRYDRLHYKNDFYYYDRVTQNGYALEYEGEDERKIPRITTIHGAKGRQAEQVVVFTEMSGKCWDDFETEHRLAYVAATRTETDVNICVENRVGWARDSYDYPVPEETTAKQEESWLK